MNLPKRYMNSRFRDVIPHTTYHTRKIKMNEATIRAEEQKVEGDNLVLKVIEFMFEGNTRLIIRRPQAEIFTA